MSNELTTAGKRVAELLAAADFTAAEALLAELAQRYPQEFSIWNNLGAVRDQLNLPQRAVKAYERATALRPDHAAGHYNLALVLKACGRLDDALAAYDRALVNDPGNAAIHINLGAALLEADRPGQAFAILFRAVELAPDSTIACFNLGVAAREVSRASFAANCFEKVLKEEPDNVEALHELGESYLDSGRHALAFEQFSAALERRIANGPLEDRSAETLPLTMSSDNARAALFTVADALEAAGVSFVLSGGTALGCVRDGDFIAHDGDIDLIALPGSSPEKIAGAFDTADTLRVEAIQYQDDRLLRVIVNHERSVRTDVFLYHEAEDGWWFGISRGAEALCWVDSPFEPQETEFHGRTFLLPSPSERYLTENYGADWRTPNNYHVAGFTARNIRNDYFSFPRSIGYALISRSIRDGELRAARFHCAIARERDPSDLLVQKIAEKLAKILND